MRWGLTKWDKEKENRELTPFDALRSDFNSLVKDFFGESELSSHFSGTFSPKVDIREDEKAYIVEAELPGIDEKDIDVQLNNSVLTIKGEVKEEHENKDKKNYRMERRYGSFTRSFGLPEEVKADEIKASYKKGILKIELPKDEAKAPKKLKIDVE